MKEDNQTTNVPINPSDFMHDEFEIANGETYYNYVCTQLK